MAYIEIFAAANDLLFQGRCQVAVWVAAQNIIAEPAETPDHASRADWAVRVLQDKSNATPRQIAMQVLRNPVIAADPAASKDTDLQYQVNSVIPDLVKVG